MLADRGLRYLLRNEHLTLRLCMWWYPGVAAASVIAMPHPCWDERSLLFDFNADDCTNCFVYFRHHWADIFRSLWLHSYFLCGDLLRRTEGLFCGAEKEFYGASSGHDFTVCWRAIAGGILCFDAGKIFAPMAVRCLVGFLNNRNAGFFCVIGVF